MDEDRTQLEQTVRSACEAKDFDSAATLAIEAYSSEIISFLCARLRSRSDGDEAFSMFAEDLWRGLPQFAWRCSLRTWAYALARNAANRYQTSPQNRAERNLTLSQPGRLSALIDRERTRTALHKRTEVKDQFRALRERFDPEDQMLLILRVDRDMAWRDIAIAMSGDTSLDDDVIAREAARLRKNFERLKSELRRAAEAAGLLDERS